MKLANNLPQWVEDNLSDGIIDSLLKIYYYNSIYDWTYSLFIVLGAVIIARAIYWFTKKFGKRFVEKTKTKLDDILVDKMEEPVVFGIVIIGLWWGVDRLTFPESTHGFISNTFQVLIAIDITWFIARTIDAMIVQYIAPRVKKSEGDLDDQLLPILRKGLRTIIWIIGIIVGLNNAGYNVSALLAGVGIGGLAMAMAAKDFVANIFGGITVFIDKPFRVGDRIQIDGYDGTVKEIGIRSTKMDTLAGRMVTIPNHKFTDSYVENVSAEPSRKVKLVLGLTYDTSSEGLEEAVKILNDIAIASAFLEDNHVASFTDFGDFSLGITFIYYIKKGEDVMHVTSDINKQILTRFNAAKLEFAFPTQTLHTSVAKN
ncbi:MAG: MscS family membrane protein [Gammaproteobacteria bacterium]